MRPPIATKAPSSRRHLSRTLLFTTATTTTIVPTSTTTTPIVTTNNTTYLPPQSLFRFCAPPFSFLCNNPSCPSLTASLIDNLDRRSFSQSGPDPADLSFFRPPSPRQSTFLSSCFPNSQGIYFTPRLDAAFDTGNCDTLFSSSLGGFLGSDFLFSYNSVFTRPVAISQGLCMNLNQILTPFRLLFEFSM